METPPHSATAPIEATRFMADAMVGKLAKWLRILGYDVAYERKIDDRRLIERALAEDRLIMTRDEHLVRRKFDPKLRFIFIRYDHLPDQLRQVVLELGLSVSAGLLTRCTACNGPIFPVPAEAVAGRVPPYVRRTQSRFSRCPECHRIYWYGTHPERIQDRLKKVFARTGG